MATDRALPGVLDAARRQVETLAADFDALAKAVRNATPSGTTWTGPAARKFSTDRTNSAKSLAAQAKACRALAATIAGEKAAVEEKIRIEIAAERAAARAAAEAKLKEAARLAAQGR